MSQIYSPTVLIVNADDFGMSTSINEGIESAHRNGILTSASLMAVGDEFESALLIAKNNPDLGIGLHITLVEESPLSATTDIPSLIDENGGFHGNAKLFGARYLAGRIQLAEVHLEIEKQFVKVHDAGIRVSHVDSHQHVHLLPGVNKIICQLASKFGIKRIRRTNEPMSLGSVNDNRSLTRFIELGLIRVLNSMNRNAPLLSTDYFAGFKNGGNLNEENLEAIIAKLKQGCSIELMCHPGTEADPGKAHWNYNWKSEHDALNSEKIKKALIDKNITLINWNAIS